MENFYFYKMTTHSGGAPCVENGMLSLAICKPRIRRTARGGDIIIGFGGKKLGEKLIYVAKISKVVVTGDYYRDNASYTNRQDCIYRWQGDELVFKVGSKFHGQEHRDHDVGLAGQHRNHANVLIADDFVYFGKEGTDDYKHDFDRLKKSIEALTQGHRINHSRELWDQLSLLYQGCISGFCEIQKPAVQPTANSAERNLTAVMAVPNPAVCEKSRKFLDAESVTARRDQIVKPCDRAG